jgi:hypothetical protein
VIGVLVIGVLVIGVLVIGVLVIGLPAVALEKERIIFLNISGFYLNMGCLPRTGPVHIKCALVVQPSIKASNGMPGRVQMALEKSSF